MENVVRPLLGIPRLSKLAIVVAIDCALSALAVWLAYYLRLGYFVLPTGRALLAMFFSIMLMVPIFYQCGLYRISFRRAGIEIVPQVAVACAIYGVFFSLPITFYSFDYVPRTIGIIQPILLLLLISIFRIVGGGFLSGRVKRRRDANSHGRVLIYGAGSAGTQLAGAISASGEFDILGILDDDKSLHGARVAGFVVYPPRMMPELISKHGITDIFLAIPSASRRRRVQIIEEIRGLPVAVRTLPGLMDLAHGRVEASDLRKMTIEDLLTRDPVPHETAVISDRLRDEVIMVTGAGGSIGSELCRQIAAAKPKRILLLENGEPALYAVHRELLQLTEADVVPLLGSVTDRFRVKQIMQTWSPSIVFHAAAYKHVPLVEHNPLQGLRNNVIGTLRVAEAAMASGVRDFVLISTDKAVRPTNIMGATKRLAELVLQGLASSETRTRFCMVRFGNVLGSSGSVVPLFKEQLERGGPITITDPEVTRYFMTIPEAAQLVLQASVMARGGEVFVLDMGDPVRIIDLARNMIQLSGLTLRDNDHPQGDIEIKVVGLRPGEKLYEELLIGNEPLPTEHSRIMKASEHFIPWMELRPQLDLMIQYIECGEVTQARDLLQSLVAEFAPASDTVDWVAVANTG